MRSALNIYAALMPIHPRYSTAILRHEKKVEFRKMYLKQKPLIILLYATRPQQNIVGLFTVADFDIDTPISLWQKYGSVGGVSYDEFMAYYCGKESGVAIKIDTAIEFQSPISLHDFEISTYTPQSAVYIAFETLIKILEPSVLKKTLSFALQKTEN